MEQCERKFGNRDELVAPYTFVRQRVMQHPASEWFAINATYSLGYNVL